MNQHDVLIIGSGLAGLSLALRLADATPPMRVCLITKNALMDAASAWAQGGIAAVLAGDDSVDEHIQDTLVAGAGLCHEDTVRLVVENGREAIEWLVAQGVPFDRQAADGPGAHASNGTDLHLTREGGHSHRRIAHAADATGRAVQQTLVSKLREHPGIDVLENHIAVDLITSRKLGGRVSGPNRCLGAYVLDKTADKVITLSARFTALATGGAGKAYLYTTNPDIATGDGLAMGWRAGCRVANLEFIQFHPTCLFHPAAKSFLITEAVRGEGGLLKLPNSLPAPQGDRRFMPDHDVRAELAPRDIVARAIDYEMKKRGLDCVNLDISHKPAEFIETHFPNILARCREFGIDITREPIPVVPAAHYTCGGLVTDLHGQTDLPGLYALGEVACTGLHGANRLASNSLLECLVFSDAAARHILGHRSDHGPALPAWDESRVSDRDEEVVISHNWEELRRFMWDYVGIVRTNKRLQRAQHRIALLKSEIQEYYANFRVSNDLIELRNLVVTADLIVRCALARHESRGLHYSLDHPNQLSDARDTVLIP
jgi:L-aspartate oxidase